MDYINTSHPNFIGGRKAVEVARQMTSRVAAPVARQKVKLFFVVVIGLHLFVFPLEMVELE